MFKWRRYDQKSAPVQTTEDKDAQRKEQAPPSRQALWNTLAMRPAPLEQANAVHPADPRVELLSRAGSEAESRLDESVRRPMDEVLGADLGGVRVHEGSASAAAAESIGARAYTIGSDIHLGAGASQSDSEERERVLIHEAVHTVQQGGASIPLAGTLAVSRPNDSSEAEARSITDSATRPRKRWRISRIGNARCHASHSHPAWHSA